MRSLLTHLYTRTGRMWLIATKSLSIALVGAAVLLFLADHIASRANAINAARAELAGFNKRYELIDKLRNDYAILEPELPRLAQAIPPVDNFLMVSAYVEQAIAKTANTGTAQFAPLPTINDRGLHELSFSVSLSGSLLTLQDLLKELEAAPYLISIRSVTTTFEHGLSGEAKMQLLGTVYFKDAPL